MSTNNARMIHIGQVLPPWGVEVRPRNNCRAVPNKKRFPVCSFLHPRSAEPHLLMFLIIIHSLIHASLTHSLWARLNFHLILTLLINTSGLDHTTISSHAIRHGWVFAFCSAHGVVAVISPSCIHYPLHVVLLLNAVPKCSLEAVDTCRAALCMSINIY